MPSLLTLTDVMATGHHAALCGAGRAREDGRRRRRRRRRPVRRDRGASASAPSRSILLGRHPDAHRAREGVRRDRHRERARRRGRRARARADGRTRRSLRPRVRRPRAGDRDRARASSVRAAPSAASACRRTRRSHKASRRSSTTSRSAGGPAPARAYIEELLPDVLEGRIEPGRVFDRTGGLDDVPDGYRAMNDREAIKVMVEP